MKPSAMAASTAFGAEAAKVCVGRLWQSMQSIVRDSTPASWASVTPSALNTVTVPLGREPDARDHLALVVGGPVLDLVAGVHVPVDALARLDALAAAADVHRQRGVALGVGLVVGVLA